MKWITSTELLCHSRDKSEDVRAQLVDAVHFSAAQKKHLTIAANRAAVTHEHCLILSHTLSNPENSIVPLYF